MNSGFAEPMLARLVGRLPDPASRRGGYLFEPKWDGFRAIARVDESGAVSLTSRRAKHIAPAFPDVVAAVHAGLPRGTAVDGEIVRWSAEGRLDFDALQRRNRAGRRVADLARTEPCHYVVFDLLERDGLDMRGLPLSARRAALGQVLAHAPKGSALMLGLQTDDIDQAREWFDSLAAVGIEGLVVKGAADPYRPGMRGWLKVKNYSTTEAIVGGITGDLVRPRELILGRRRRSTGRFIMVGRSTCLDDRAASELAAAVTPAGHEHPWPSELPPSLSGAMYGRRAAARYMRVTPDVVVEVRVDVATARHQWRHSVRFVRLRRDLLPEDVPTDLEVEA